MKEMYQITKTLVIRKFIFTLVSSFLYLWIISVYGNQNTVFGTIIIYYFTFGILEKYIFLWKNSKKILEQERNLRNNISLIVKLIQEKRQYRYLFSPQYSQPDDDIIEFEIINKVYKLAIFKSVVDNNLDQIRSVNIKRILTNMDVKLGSIDKYDKDTNTLILSKNTFKNIQNVEIFAGVLNTICVDFLQKEKALGFKIFTYDVFNYFLDEICIILMSDGCESNFQSFRGGTK